MSIWAEMTDGISSACVDAFGEGVIYTPKSGSSFPLDAIFDAAHVVIDGGGEVGIETVKPVLAVQNSRFKPEGHPAPKQGDRVRISGVDYKVREVQPDGTSETLLILMKER